MSITKHISELHRVKSEIILWKAQVYDLIQAKCQYSNCQPGYTHTDCTFGRWYYGQGRQKYGHLDTYASIEEPHKVLHHIYHDIYSLLQRKKYRLAEQKMQYLEQVVNDLINILDLLTEEVRFVA